MAQNTDLRLFEVHSFKNWYRCSGLLTVTDPPSSPNRACEFWSHIYTHTHTRTHTLLLCFFVTLLLCFFAYLFLSFFVSFCLCFFISLFLCLFVSLFLCFFVSLFRCFFISLFLGFVVSLFLCFFASLFLCLSVSCFFGFFSMFHFFSFTIVRSTFSRTSREGGGVLSQWVPRTCIPPFTRIHLQFMRRLCVKFLNWDLCLVPFLTHELVLFGTFWWFVRRDWAVACEENIPQTAKTRSFSVCLLHSSMRAGFRCFNFFPLQFRDQHFHAQLRGGGGGCCHSEYPNMYSTFYKNPPTIYEEIGCETFKQRSIFRAISETWGWYFWYILMCTL